MFSRLEVVVMAVLGKKGGSLASAIHTYMQHGDPSIRALVKHTLRVVSFRILCRDNLPSFLLLVRCLVLGSRGSDV